LIAPVLSMKYAALTIVPSSCNSPREPGTIQMLHSLATAQYVSRYLFQLAHCLRISGSCPGAKSARWYSGRTARSAPAVAASLMNDTALW
jgi:hypothetical protein